MAMRLMSPGERTKPGGWYFFVACRNCNSDIIFAEAPSLQEEERTMVQGVKATCTRCQTVDSYRADEVQRGQVDGSSSLGHRVESR